MPILGSSLTNSLLKLMFFIQVKHAHSSEERVPRASRQTAVALSPLPAQPLYTLFICFLHIFLPISKSCAHTSVPQFINSGRGLRHGVGLGARTRRPFCSLVLRASCGSMSACFSTLGRLHHDSAGCVPSFSMSCP